MSQYSIQFSTAADRQFRRLPRDAQKRAASAIDLLADDPRPHSARPLAGSEHLWRMRVGNYRIVYRIEDDRLVVLVVKVGHRRDVYRGL